MRISAGIAGMESASKKRTSAEINKRFSDMDAEAVSYGNNIWAQAGNRLQERAAAEDTEGEGISTEGEEGAFGYERSEAAKIYEAAVSSKPNPIAGMREAPKVPYGHLAKDGTIVYNGVCFVCDEDTNSICLGDMTDKENVLTITLSGGGHLKVHRDSIGLLSKAAGMFSAEDLNLIMRAISLDTRLQSMQKEIEDEEASVGEEITQDGAGTQADARAAVQAEENRLGADERWSPDDLAKVLQ